MKLLIDTNVLIPLEPGVLADEEPGSQQAREMFKLAMETGSVVYLHPIQRQDIEQDKKADRRELRLSLIKKYPLLPKPPVPSTPFLALIGSPKPNTNHWIDAHLIAALIRDLISILVTEDKGIHTRCQNLNLASRCRTVAQTIEILREELPTNPGRLPAIQAVLAHELNESDPIFDSFRDDYPGFDDWLKKCREQHRPCWTVKLPEISTYAGICIVNREDRNWSDAKNPTLKICSFKIADEALGAKLGELLLHAVLSYANENDYCTLFIETFDKQPALIYLLECFGFRQSGQKAGESGELELRKLMLPIDSQLDMTPLAFHQEFGPYQISLDGVRIFVVPIEPKFHQMLFPDIEEQRSLFEGKDPCGNTLRKVYLCNAVTKQIRPGDVLLFYKSHDQRKITAIGIVEETIRTDDTDDLERFALKRTVYERSDIKAMTEGRNALGILFRYAPILKDGISLRSLTDSALLNGVPQSIVQIKEDDNSWLKAYLK